MGKVEQLKSKAIKANKGVTVPPGADETEATEGTGNVEATLADETEPAEGTGNVEATASDETEITEELKDPFGIADMTMQEIKDMLKTRNLSFKGSIKVIGKRLSDRLEREQDPEYVPFVKGRHCKWCGAVMKKRKTFKGDEFYGCSTFPKCQYTTSMSGHARPEREALKGVEAKPWTGDSRYYERMYG